MPMSVISCCILAVLKLSMPAAGERRTVDVALDSDGRADVSVDVPVSDIQQLWTPDMQLPYLERKWRIVKDSSPQSSMPCIAYFNLAETNVLFFGADALDGDGRIVSRMNQERGVYEVSFSCAAGADRPEKRFKVTLDRRAVPWTEAVGEWRESLPYKRGRYPDGAWKPVFCSWYAVHAAVTSDWTERMAAIAADLGFGTFILDDGWSYDEVRRVNPGTIETWYRDVGKWDSFSPVKFPDFRAHCARMHALGLNYVVWVAPYFIGIRSDAYRRWGFEDRKGAHAVEGNVLADIENRQMMADVTEQLVSLLEDSGIDGLKVDFLDYVPTSVDRPHGALAHAYVTDLMRRLRNVRPNGLFEFRQNYATPANAALATQFRAGDVPFEWQANLLRLAQIRLCMGDGVPIHSDPICWADAETDDNVSRHFMAAMAGVPMLSTDLGKLSPRRRDQIRGWIGLYTRRIARFQREGVWKVFYRNGGLSGLVSTRGDEALALVADPRGFAELCVNTGRRKLLVLNLGYEELKTPNGVRIAPASYSDLSDSSVKMAERASVCYHSSEMSMPLKSQERRP